ncbi:hypothetical protein [Mesorhizobium sp. M0323]|uniref:hypothetical protein n=1 Tax=Mesorhizobium sp. M0323 TaxID=2956938 RepID=UPI00333CAF3C
MMIGLPGCQHARDHEGEPAQRRRPRVGIQPLPAGGSGCRLWSSSANLNSSCMSLLLVVGRRLAAPLKESVGHKAQMQKVCKPPNAPMICWRGGGTTARCCEIRPRCGNVGAAAVGQFHKQRWHAAALKSADYCQSPPFKGMALASDRHTRWKVPVMGSLETVPSGLPARNGLSASWIIGSVTSASSV